MGNIVNRVFDSSGPEGKVRGTPQQIIDKYNQLARDAQLSNDRVAFENFQQHAEHYTRMLGEAMREQEASRQQHQQPGGEDRGGDEGPRDDGPRDQGYRDQGYRDQDRRNQGPRDQGRDQGRDQDGRNQNRRDRPLGGEDRAEEPRMDPAQDRRVADDVIDLSQDDVGGLVETPESATGAPDDVPAEAQTEEPARPPRRRRPRKSEGGAEGRQDVKPEAAE
jgi:hypothetical protein